MTSHHHPTEIRNIVLSPVLTFTAYRLLIGKQEGNRLPEKARHS
jgi:hypothetical protein